ncbi:MAG: thioesterase family protein [Clostridiales bacterium]|jgi:predicted thioesterase|nr:thioesterase family protein [Clostridiales bacterium]
MIIAITLPTLESRAHQIDSIKDGVKLYNESRVEFERKNGDHYSARVSDETGILVVDLTVSRDGLDLDDFFCDCGAYDNEVCKHVTAAVLSIQGGITETEIKLGKTASVAAAVTEANTAHAVGSGDLEVFATPMMVALMEQAACKALSGALETGKTSVGVSIEAAHIAASPVGAKITATATIVSVNGKTIKFDVTAFDEAGEIGKGTHTRVIVNESKFLARANARKAEI